MCLVVCVGEKGVRDRRGDGVWSGSTGVVSCIYGVEPFLTMGGFLAVSIRAALELYDAPPPSLITATSLHVCLALRTPSRNFLVRAGGELGRKKKIENQLQTYTCDLRCHVIAFFFF